MVTGLGGLLLLLLRNGSLPPSCCCPLLARTWMQRLRGTGCDQESEERFEIWTDLWPREENGRRKWQHTLLRLRERSQLNSNWCLLFFFPHVLKLLWKTNDSGNKENSGFNRSSNYVLGLVHHRISQSKRLPRQPLWSIPRVFFQTQSEFNQDFHTITELTTVLNRFLLICQIASLRVLNTEQNICLSLFL